MTLRQELSNVRGADPAQRWWYLQRARSKLFSRWVARSFEHFGEGAQIWLPIALWGAQRMSIGANVTIASGARISTDKPGRLVIGDNTLMMGETMIHAIDSIVIGRDVGIGRGAVIVDYDFRGDRDTPVRLRPKVSAPVTIGDGAVIFAGATVTAGVTIGRNAVVGSNAVVTRDVEDHQVVAGAPARPVRSPA